MKPVFIQLHEVEDNNDTVIFQNVDCIASFGDSGGSRAKSWVVISGPQQWMTRFVTESPQEIMNLIRAAGKEE